MKARTYSTLLFLSLAVCGGDDPPQDTDGVITSASGVLSVDEITTSAPEPSPGSLPDAAGTTGAQACLEDLDCEPNYECVKQRCELEACFEQEIQHPIIAPNVVLVLDKSRSMVLPELFWDHDEDPETEPESRWQTLHRVVSQVTTDFDASMNLGVQLFPSLDATASATQAACVVNDTPEVPVAPMNAETVLAGIPAAGELELYGGTPAERGVASAVEHLLSLPALDENGEEVDRYTVLITDGGANCSTDAQSNGELTLYDENFIGTIEQANLDGVKTFVVGVDIDDSIDSYGTNAYEVLNDAALAGGLARDGEERFYNAKNMVELSDALSALVDEILPCTIALDPPANTLFESLEIDGVDYEIPLDEDVEGCSGKGWVFADEAKSAIVLCSALCLEYQMTGELELNYACPPG